MFKFFIACIILYFLFRFITRFVLPVMNVTRTAAQRMREMQQQMEHMQRNQQQQTTTTSQQVPPAQQPGEYIDYEEVK